MSHGEVTIEGLPDRDTLLSAADEVRTVLARNPNLSGEEVRTELIKAADYAPVVPMPLTWHLLVDENQPYTFCGEFPGPADERWHKFEDATGLMEKFTTGQHCCPACILVVGRAAERQAEKERISQPYHGPME